MSVSGAASLIIVCPHCATRYQLPPEALGPRGRRVQCASCGEAWRANPPAPSRRKADTLPLAPEDERDLDQSFAREERRAVLPERWADETLEAERSLADIRAALGPAAPRQTPSESAEQALKLRRESLFQARIAALHRHLPSTRFRRALRLGFGSALLIVLAGLLLWRVEIVRQFPELAGAYAALGLPVNVIGLEFREVATIVSREDGAEIMRVSAIIVAASGRHAVVPPVIVTLLGERGETLYRWSVTPATRDLAPGERFEFSTRITTPPPGTVRVRLGFAENRPLASASGGQRPGEPG